MVTLGSGKFSYEVSGDDWGNIPSDWTYKEGTAVAVDSKDNVFLFNRGTHFMIVFDQKGNVLRTWGDDIFTNPHGVYIDPEDNVWCIDNGDHTVRKFTPEGKLLMTLGKAGDKIGRRRRNDQLISPLGQFNMPHTSFRLRVQQGRPHGLATEGLEGQWCHERFRPTGHNNPHLMARFL